MLQDTVAALALFLLDGLRKPSGKTQIPINMVATATFSTAMLALCLSSLAVMALYHLAPLGQGHLLLLLQRPALLRLQPQLRSQVLRLVPLSQSLLPVATLLLLPHLLVATRLALLLRLVGTLLPLADILHLGVIQQVRQVVDTARKHRTTLSLPIHSQRIPLHTLSQAVDLILEVGQAQIRAAQVQDRAKADQVRSQVTVPARADPQKESRSLNV